MKICVYTICKNEIKNLEDWLNSIERADYIVLLDTGSTDGTWEAIQNNPRIISSQKIYKDFRFDTARTDAFRLCPHDTDVCINIDLDERISKNWREEIEKNYKGYPMRCPYINDTSPSIIGSKIIAHPYYSDIIWKGEIFEEPFYFDGNFYRSYWSFMALPTQTLVSSVLVKHYKDEHKDRAFYDDKIKQKIENSFKKIRTENLKYEELMQEMLFLVECLNSFASSYNYYMREAIGKLAEKHLQTTGSTWVSDRLDNLDKCFLQIMQIYHKLTGDMEEAVNYTECLYKNLLGSNKSVYDQILLRDGVDIFIATGQVKKAYEIVVDNVYNTLEIKTEGDLFCLQLALNTAEHFCNDLHSPFLFPAIRSKVSKEVKNLFDTGSFKPFKLSRPKKV